jgi:Sec7-like guanine-nucleotide exchange factor
VIGIQTGFDCAFVLAYSIIMLNTDLHNEKLEGQKRLSKKEFIANNRRSPDLATIGDDYFGSIYDEILNEEFKMFDDDEIAAVRPKSPPCDLVQHACGGAHLHVLKRSASPQSAAAAKTNSFFDIAPSTY